MSGLEATQQIRQMESNEPSLSPVPIVALSAGAMKGDREKGLEVGMTDYLYKPVSQAPLLETIRKCFL
jgi:CheY-like chemotaxis protein